MFRLSQELNVLTSSEIRKEENNMVIEDRQVSVGELVEALGILCENIMNFCIGESGIA